MAIASSVPANAQLPDGMLTVYSNICFNRGSGDLNGLRIILFRSAAQDRSKRESIYVFYQETAGLLAAPLQEPATVDGDNLRIDLHFPDRSMRTFVARITPDLIDGHYIDGLGKPRYLLKRDPDPMNKFSECVD
ncbi:MAG TPA: hypothetical protein VMI56_08190 [Reyranella sp.]|nr:hypothetical protein [Reyranella sp.]